MSARLRETKAMNAKNAEILRGLLKLPDNRLCVDCKRNDARWASTNLGIFLCIRCSGIHRGLGVHISRVRSVDLDTWNPEQIANMQRWGNAKANLHWEAHLKEGHQPAEHKIEQFIRSKYESKRWAMEGPAPDPETLAVPGTPATATQVTSPTAEAPAASTIKSPTANKSSAIDLLGGAFGDSSASSRSASKASPSLAYPSPPSARASSLSSPVTTNGQTRAQQPTPASQPKVAAALAPTSTQNNGNGLFDLDFNSTQAPSTNNASTSRKNANDIMSLFGNSTSVSSPQAQSASTGNGLDAFASLNLGGPGASTWATPATSNSNFGASSQQQQQSIHASYGQSNTRPASNSISGGNPWAAAPAVDTAISKNAQTFNNFHSSPPANNTSKPPAHANAMSNDFFSTPASSNNFTSPGKSAAPVTNTATNTHSNMDFFNSQDIWGAPVSNNKPPGADAFGGFSSGSTGKTSGGGFDDLWN